LNPKNSPPNNQQDTIHYLHRNNSGVTVFCWIPSHIGISGDGKATQTAKSALYLLMITVYSLPYYDITSWIKKKHLPGGNAFGM